MYTVENVSSVANFITAYEESLKPRRPFFFVSNVFFVFFVSKSNLEEFYLNTLTCS